MTKELFGHFDEKDGVFSSPGFYINEADLVVRGRIIPLYLESVPGREWVGLTAKEVEKIVDDNTQDDQGYDIWCSGRDVARLVEALLKERNT